MSDCPLALCGLVKAYIGRGCTTGRVLVNDVTLHGPDRLWLQVTAPPRAINTSSLLQWRDSILFIFLAFRFIDIPVFIACTQIEYDYVYIRCLHTISFVECWVEDVSLIAIFRGFRIQ